MEPEHTTPWKLASTYALLSIAESLVSRTVPASQPAHQAMSDSLKLTRSPSHVSAKRRRAMDRGGAWLKRPHMPDRLPATSPPAPYNLFAGPSSRSFTA